MCEAACTTELRVVPRKNPDEPPLTQKFPERESYYLKLQAAIGSF